MKRRWPSTRTAVSLAPHLFPLAPEPCTVIDDYMWIEPDTTACKHGLGPCAICGTTNEREVRHKTVGGRGEIARLRKKP